MIWEDLARYSDQEVLSGFSLRVEAGETCALVGLSGCGKTTALRLLLGDFKPQKGSMVIGSQAVQDMSLSRLRHLVSVAPQAPALLGGSVKEAIEFGAPKAVPLSTVEDVARTALAEAFVLSRPQGYGAPVGRGGALLSGGERQRLALARALIRESPVLLLDEPTSGLDAATAEGLAEAMLSRPSRPTTLIATHCLPLIRSCDSVAVIKEGRVVQHGGAPRTRTRMAKIS